MSRPSRTSRPSTSNTFLAVLGGGVALSIFVGLVMFVVHRSGCHDRKFAVGAPIPLASYDLTISYVEARSSRVDNLELWVHVKWEPVEARHPKRRSLFAGKFPRFTLMDRQGREFRWSSMQLKPDGGDADRLVVFAVPPDSGGFTAVITNPRMEEGQPCVATVPLGR